jgi:hypothetical protein
METLVKVDDICQKQKYGLIERTKAVILSHQPQQSENVDHGHGYEDWSFGG